MFSVTRITQHYHTQPSRNKIHYFTVYSTSTRQDQQHSRIKTRLRGAILSATLCNGDAIVAKSRKEFYISSRLLQLVKQHFHLHYTVGYTRRNAP